MGASSAIALGNAPEEREYGRYLAEVEARHLVVAQLQAELGQLQDAMSQFEAEYHARVGLLFLELDRLQLAIEEYARRVAALHAFPTAEPDEIERGVREEFADRHDDIDRGEEEIRGYKRLHTKFQMQPALTRSEQDQMLRLYRDLARRYHPDLARSDEERSRRVPVMQRVNEAFQGKDIAVLRAVAQEADQIDPDFDQRPIGERLVWAIREVARLDEVVDRLRGEIKKLRSSDAFVLWQRQEAGEQVVDVLEGDLRRELADARVRLEALIVTFRSLLEARDQ